MIYIPEIPYIYPVCILLSFLITFFVVYLQNRNINKEILTYFFLTVFICSITGGCLFSVAENLIKNRTLQIGLSAYGGAIGLLTGCIFIPKLLSTPVQKLTKDTILSLPLMYGLSKLACGLNGCCHGFEYRELFSVVYSNNVPYFPVQFLETLTFIIIFVIVYLVNKKTKINSIGFMMVLSGTAKGLLDFLRYGHHGISINQAVSLIFIFIGLFLVFKVNSKKEALE